jgi:CDP-glucose 4,6-dehydratase
MGVAMGFWSGKRVLVTGHTGFKGSWLCAWLLMRGADVHGLALAPETQPALFDQLGLAGRMGHAVGDIRDPQVVMDRIVAVSPAVVFHLAAQPLVRRSYRDPAQTWGTNVMGTVHVLESLRRAMQPCAVVVITTDKVYANREWEHAYRETDRLGGHDPYSASKAATELVVDSYRQSFRSDGMLRLATARAGNVIGGGDWAEDRILPDLARALMQGQAVAVRNPAAVRPWQHVLDPVAGYIMLAEKIAMSEDPVWQGAFNFGPEAADQRSVADLVAAALHHWPGRWTDVAAPGAVHEAGRLALTIDKARSVLGWSPRWNFDRAVAETIGWYRDVAGGADARDLTERQITAYGPAA